ncbi:Golgi apyrase, partial [Borealophlyctis nickersoniae]
MGPTEHLVSTQLIMMTLPTGRKIDGLALAIVAIIVFFVTFLSMRHAQSGPSAVTAPTHRANAKGDPDQAVLNLQIGFTPNEQFSPESDDTGETEWARYRQYAIVIDAGSSGSRVLVYSWKDPLYVKHVAESDRRHGENMLRGLPVIEKGSEHGEWQFKEEPGISSYASNPGDVISHLRPLLNFAKRVVPEHRHDTTPIYLLATAGMRLISSDAQDAILGTACRYVGHHYKFAIDGGCDMHFRIISGELEGIYGWAAINYLKNGFGAQGDKSGKEGGKHTFGFLDMGGASTQIAFEPTPEMAALHGDDLTKMKMRSIDGTEVEYNVFVTTFLGFGMNEARRRYIEGLIREASHVHLARRTARPRFEDAVESDDPLAKNSAERRPATSGSSKIRPRPQAASGEDESFVRVPPLDVPPRIRDPCLPAGLELEDKSHMPITALTPPLLEGTGAFQTCLTKQIPLLNKSLP